MRGEPSPSTWSSPRRSSAWRRRPASCCGSSGASDGRVTQQFTVRAVRVPAYRGDVNGLLPALHVAAGRGGASEPTRRSSCAARAACGSTSSRATRYFFQTRVGGRTTYGRRLLLFDRGAGGAARRATCCCSPSAPTRCRGADAVGSNGALKTALRSFRFGTSAREPRSSSTTSRRSTCASAGSSRSRTSPRRGSPAWKLRVDFGPELGVKRSSAQIRNYPREELEGRLVVAVVNFPPRQIGPVRSEVLVLGTYSGDVVLSAHARAGRGARR